MSDEAVGLARLLFRQVELQLDAVAGAIAEKQLRLAQLDSRVDGSDVGLKRNRP